MPRNEGGGSVPAFAARVNFAGGGYLPTSMSLAQEPVRSRIDFARHDPDASALVDSALPDRSTRTLIAAHAQNIVRKPMSTIGSPPPARREARYRSSAAKHSNRQGFCRPEAPWDLDFRLALDVGLGCSVRRDHRVASEDRKVDVLRGFGDGTGKHGGVVRAHALRRGSSPCGRPEACSLHSQFDGQAPGGNRSCKRRTRSSKPSTLAESCRHS